MFTLFSLTACDYREATQQKKKEMFASFGTMENSIILTPYQLFIGEQAYDRADFEYNGRWCEILCVEEDGFYAYTVDDETLNVEFLFTDYDNFDTVLLGVGTLPSRVINAFFSDRCFWFRMDDPAVDKFKQLYYVWGVDTQQMTILDGSEVAEEYEYSADNNKSKTYTFVNHSKFLGSYLEITHKETNVTKTIDRSVLDAFEEGKKIKRNGDRFDVAQAFEKDGWVYFTSYYEVGFLGYPHYYYVLKWNFKTEECMYYTSILSEEEPCGIVDMYIP